MRNRTDSPSFLRPACLVLAALSVVAGGLGMVVSFVALSFRNPADVIAGASGFVAGSILVGSGLLSLSILAAPTGDSTAVHEPRPDSK